MSSNLDARFERLTLTEPTTHLKRRKKLDLNDPFNHILYFHTRCKSSSGYNSDSPNIDAGLYDVSEFSIDSVKDWVDSHAWPGMLRRTPFKSVTTDLLRALNYALRLQALGREGIEVIIIDAWILGPYNVMPCNKLRELVGEPRDHLFDTELLVYRSIPGNAIISRIEWPVLCGSLGEALPPLSDLRAMQNGQRPLENLRRSLHGQKLDLSNLIRIILDDFHLSQGSLVAKQIAMMIVGWTRGYSSVWLYKNLRNSLECGAGKQDIDELDCRLYTRELRERHILLSKLVPHEIESLEVTKEKTTRYTDSLPPTFQDWLAERLTMEKTSFLEACEQEPQASDLIPRLISIGVNAKPTWLQRCFMGLYTASA